MILGTGLFYYRFLSIQPIQSQVNSTGFTLKQGDALFFWAKTHRLRADKSGQA